MTKRFKITYHIKIVVLAVAAEMLLGAVVFMVIGADVIKTYQVILT